MGFAHLLLSFVFLPLMFGFGFILDAFLLDYLSQHDYVTTLHSTHRKIQLSSIAASFFLILISKLPVVFAQALQPKGLNNNHPRAQQQQLTGWGARATAGHYNSIEAFAPFALGVIVAQQNGVAEDFITRLCLIFVATRVLYLLAYIFNLGSLRSILWVAGFWAVVALFLAPICPCLTNALNLAHLAELTQTKNLNLNNIKLEL